mmetsp:Transcript_39438/g.91055  ORF Transcript_39438/g.91055 Transcript_39438/m.91055 type:complete len:119 (-) Transcript_39438:46-402(-)
MRRLTRDMEQERVPSLVQACLVLGSICEAGSMQLLLLPVFDPSAELESPPHILLCLFSPMHLFVGPELELYVYACLVCVIYVQLFRIWRAGSVRPSRKCASCDHNLLGISGQLVCTLG